jgi:hypothetical protein
LKRENFGTVDNEYEDNVPALIRIQFENPNYASPSFAPKINDSFGFTSEYSTSHIPYSSRLQTDIHITSFY